MEQYQDLQVFLREKAKDSKPEAEIDWELKKNTYLRNVEELYELVRTWLAPLVAEGLVKFANQKSQLEEEPIGIYRVDIFRVMVGHQEIVFYPKGFLIVGAEGRIDIRGYNGIRTIIVNDNQWSVVERAARLKIIPFNEQSFQDILSEVME